MPRGPEATTEKKLRLYMMERGGIFPKTVSPGNRGWPDRNPTHAFCGPFYMELKARGKKATELQVEIAEELADHGARVYLDVDSVQKGMEIIDDEVNCVPPSHRRHQPVASVSPPRKH